jgi:fatty acid desaturase
MTLNDHKAIIKGLTPAQRLELLAQSDVAGLRHLVLHAGLIGICTTLIVIQAPLVPLIMLVQGILIVFLFTTLHETVHRTPFRSDWLNVWVGRMCGFMVFVAPEWFRYFHFDHHRYTNEPDRDPELAGPRPETTWQYLKYMSGIPELVDRFKALFRNAFRANNDSFVPSRGKAAVRTEARIQLGLYAGLIGLSVLAQTTILIQVWLLPFLLGAPFLRGYLLAEHAGCPHVPSMLENTRTVRTNALVRFVAWNMPYHVEHHAYPAVPFHKLADFHVHTNASITHLDEGYLRFNWTYLKSCWSNTG